MYEFRVDVGTLQPPKRMADGRLVADVLITKPGIFEYPDAKYPGGIRRELRSDEEVFSKATMDSFQMMPATQVHPPELLTPITARAWSVGATSEQVSRVRVDNETDHVASKVMVADAATIRKLEAGDTAVSVGYAVRIDERGGTHPKYGRYDVSQHDIRGNHLAVAIGQGRAGRMARVRMDAELSPEERVALAAKVRGDDIATYEQLAASAAPELIVMTTATAGHQHTLDPADSSGCTSPAKSEGEEFAHSHAWIRGVDGGITIAANAGHTHEVDTSTLGLRGDAAAAARLAAPHKFGMKQGGAIPASFDRFDAQGNGGVMDPEKLQESARALEAGLKAAEAEIVVQRTRADQAESARDVALGTTEVLNKEIVALRTQIATNASAVESAALIKERTRADALEQQVARFDETRHKEIRQRVGLMFEAATVLGTDFRMDDLSERQIRAAAVKRLDSTADVTDSVSDGVVTGLYLGLMKRRLQRARQDAGVAEVLGLPSENTRQDSREQKLEDYRRQGNKPLSEVIKKGA